MNISLWLIEEKERMKRGGEKRLETKVKGWKRLETNGKKVWLKKGHRKEGKEAKKVNRWGEEGREEERKEDKK